MHYLGDTYATYHELCLNIYLTSVYLTFKFKWVSFIFICYI